MNGGGNTNKRAAAHAAIMVLAAVLWVGCATLSGGEALDGDAVIRQRAELVVYGLSCPLCATNLDEQIERIEGVKATSIDLDTGHVLVEVEPGAAVSVGALRKAVADSGFTLQSVQNRGDEP